MRWRAFAARHWPGDAPQLSVRSAVDSLRARRAELHLCSSQQIGERALAAAGPADKCHPPATGDFEADVLERMRVAPGLGEAHASEADPLAEGKGRHGVLGILFGGQLEKRQDLRNERAVPRRERPTGIDLL